MHRDEANNRITDYSYKIVEQKDTLMLDGSKKLVQRGEPGIRTVVYEDTYRWGKKVDRKQSKVETSLEPKNEIIRVGTRKSIVLEAKSAASTLQVTIFSASRRPGGFGRIRSDAIVIKGEVKNTGTRAVRTERVTDLALINASFSGGLLILSGTPGGLLSPGQSGPKVWAGSLNGNRRGQNAALLDISQIQLTIRAARGTRSQIIGETVSLTGLPEVD